MKGDIDIIAMAFELARAVEALYEHTRRYYYEVMLSGHSCPTCGGTLTMVGESDCRCTTCAYRFDPTVVFQRCPACDGTPRLRICRYQCGRCGRDIPSRFVFDARVFDREYFRLRMAESRERQAQQRREISREFAVTRSAPVAGMAADLDMVPGLAGALDELVGVADLAVWLPLAKGFDLNRYQAHLQAHIGPIEMCFDDLPALEGNARMDRIWRFVAIIFMAHAGLVQIWQQGQTILVRTYETDTEGY